MLIPQLMLVFEERQNLDAEDEKRLEQLGYTLRKRTRWPVFEQVTPGHLHTFPETEKLKDFIPLLDQTLNVAGRVGREEFAYVEHTPLGMSGLARTPDARYKEGWRDEVSDFRVENTLTAYPNTQNLVEKLNRMPKQEVTVQADLIMIPSPIYDRTPPYFPFILLLVEKESGYVFNFELMTPHPSAEKMIAESGKKLLETLIEKNIHPGEIEVCSARGLNILKDALEGSTVIISHQSHLPALESAYEGLMYYFKK